MATMQRRHRLMASMAVHCKGISRRSSSSSSLSSSSTAARDWLDAETTRRQMEMDKQFLLLPEGKQALSRLLSSAPTQSLALSSMHDSITDLIGSYPPSGLRVMGSLLTFPLTLAFLLQRLPALHKADLRIAVAGARAEASLPAPWWRTALFSLGKVQHLHLTMVGPAQPATSPTTATQSWNGKSISITSGSHRHLLHEDPECASLLESSDAFAIFHPGLGNASMQSLWKPSLDLLLRSHKPVLGSAYSPSDLSADLRVLEGQVEWLLEPAASRFAGPATVTANGQVTANNSFLYAFRGGPTSDMSSLT